MEGLCLETNKLSKIYNKNTVRSSNQDSKIQKLFSVLWGNENVATKDIQTFHALKDVSLSLKIGESLGIIGLNGSGKSTLMQIIAGTLQPTSGKVFVRGKVAALLELGSGFNPEFTGKENVIINGEILGLTESEIKSKLQNIQNFAEIGDFFHQPVSTYSSGMVLRLAFAVLVQVNPEILIIDEALAVGDAKFQLKCFAFLEEFKNKGGTLILVSHDLNSIARLCSHSILLHEGSLLATGKPIDVINEYSKILSLDQVLIKSDSERTQILEVENTKSKEFSYGGTKAEIIDIKLLNNKNEESRVLNSGENFSVSFKVKANEKITKPIYALTIKDSKGQQVYGQNTHFSRMQVADICQDDEIQVNFRQPINLNSGDYFISVGLTRFEGDKLQVIHRRYDALEVKVVNTDGSFGITNCFSSITFIESDKLSPANYEKTSFHSQVTFNYKNNNYSLKVGELFCSNIIELSYRDTSEQNIKSIINEIELGSKWKKSVADKFKKQNPWLFDIISSSKRTKFIDEYIRPNHLKILDIGSGWGQFCIPLAKNNHVCALEPTPERLDFIKTISEKENVSKCVSFICANYQDIEFQTKFDLILSIGVLEWVGKFTNSEITPEIAQLQFLKKTKRDLLKEGKLVIGIENRLGLKYFFGANDDHTGLPHISCFNKELAKTKFKQKTNQDLQCLTYSLQEYKNLLQQAGFSKITFFAALPDYKLPEKIFPISSDHKKCELNKFIMDGGHIDEHDGTNGKKLENQEEIYSIYMSLAEMGIAHYFAPSFFIEAS
jgi:ABC-type polysaccharide/polyol phosphate transport system ATPase subunit